jgi:hypothetical protein
MWLNKIITVISVFIFFGACSKKTNIINDTSPPVVTIVSPLNHQHFNAGDIIQTTATASDNDKVVELHIHVSNASTGILLRDIHSYPGQSSGIVQDSFAAEAGISYTIKIICYDASRNLSTAQVDISVN